jgi:Ca2+-transporting ATPase
MSDQEADKSTNVVQYTVVEEQVIDSDGQIIEQRIISEDGQPIPNTASEGRGRRVEVVEFVEEIQPVTEVRETVRTKTTYETTKMIKTASGRMIDLDSIELPGEPFTIPDPAPDDPNPAPFKWSRSQLRALIDAKSLRALKAFGGVEGLVEGLNTHTEYGLADIRPMPRTGTMHSVRSALKGDNKSYSEQRTDVENRVRIYGVNSLPERHAKTLLSFIWAALQERILILLMVAAVISLALGIYEDQTNSPEEPDVHWIEGFAILVAVSIVVLVGSINDWQKDRQFRKLNAKKEDRMVKVIREGAQTQLSIHHLVVGDIMTIEPGDIVAADAIFISGHNVKCDESGITGESDAIRKRSFEECVAEIPSLGPLDHPSDPFVISGSKVLEGVGRAVVVAVGENSFHGRIMLSLRQEMTDTPLQVKLNKLAESIAKLGSGAALLMLLILIILYFARFEDQSHEAADIASNLVSIVITAVTVVVVAVPEGLPLAVTLALAFAMTRMLKDNNLVRVLAACETMGNATTVCSDKTGTLTQNRMTVVAGIVGRTRLFARVEDSVTGFPGAINIDDLVKEQPKEVTELIQQAVATNSNAFWDPTAQEFVGSKTETALLAWTRNQGAPEYTQIREQYPVEQLWPFSSERKSMCTLIRITDPADGHVLHRAHVKGASEIILSRCTRVLLADSSSLESEPLTSEVREKLLQTIEQFASQSLRTIGIAYRDFPDYDPERPLDDKDLSSDLTLICIVGIEDPLREGVVDAVRLCQRAGVTVRMVTGDNILTARAIATKCGIFTAGGIVMEGPKFRTLSNDQMREVIPRLQVLARSSPEDKRILVGKLKEMGDIVAVTGDGTNDGPALKMADIGFSMGIAGTEVAKEASSIILMDDNFASIVKAIMWGRSVNDAVKKFLQFQLTVNVTAVLLAFVSAIVSASSSDHDGSGKSVLTAVQLLWVNLIMDTLAALALATDPPTLDLLNRQPEPRTAPLITFAMWKMILFQAALQVTICLILLYVGDKIFDLSEDEEDGPTVLGTMVFNTFVWLQIFNEVNCRRLDNGINVLKGILRNRIFIGIFVFITVCQVIIVEFGGYAFYTTSLTAIQWVVCVVLGMLSLPLGAVVRLIPDRLFRCIGPIARLQDNQYRNPERDALYDWKKDIRDVRTELNVFRALRGGRLRAYRDAIPAATMLPSIVASTVGVGVSMQSQPPMAKNLAT